MFFLDVYFPSFEEIDIKSYKSLLSPATLALFEKIPATKTELEDIDIISLFGFQ